VTASSTQAVHAQTAVPPGTDAIGWLLGEDGRRTLSRIVLPLLALAAAAWVVTARTGAMGSVQVGAFVASWILMMVAMMLPAVSPVVALYARAARRSAVASVPFFVTGYLLLWAVTALPALAIARQVSGAVMTGEPWVARLAGGTLLAAAVYETSAWKTVCLRECRSPLTFFLARTGSLRQPAAAVAAGARHAAYCLGCCWALMAVLMVLGGMQLGWALALAVALSAEKVLPWPTFVTRLVAATAAALGLALLLEPSLLNHLVAGSM
jgi:predicted metal-binding membrane protein